MNARRTLRENGLSIVVFALFLLCMAGQVWSGHLQHNDELRAHGRPALGLLPYLESGHFIEATAENWQSEFLSLAAMAVFSIYLRQRGSPESKPVDAAHADTGTPD